MLISLNDLAHRYGVRPSTVIHAGAHLGEEAAGYASIGVARCLWVEANPSLIAPLGVALSKAPGPTIHRVACVAAGAELGTAVLNVANNGESSSLLPFGTHSVEHPEVEFVDEVGVAVVPLDRVAETYGHADAEMMNLDLQGFELEALRGATGLLSGPVRWVYAEINEAELYRGCGLRAEVEAFLAGFGFGLVADAMTRHGWGDALYAKDPSEVES